MSDESIFAAALGKAPGAKRRAFLDEACGGDEALRRRVERLLEADDRTAGILERGPAGLTDPHEPPGERSGDRVGPYKLLQQIGEGGMGIVYMAEQSEPVRRRVALKIIKPGMDSHQVIARFEAERQALALMDHPNIARVLDAGATETGRPYFVMELVHGVPITQFCDDGHLTVPRAAGAVRPGLPGDPARPPEGGHPPRHQAVNVLVTMYDDKPVPKVIDFGVAKAIEQRLTERTMFTQLRRPDRDVRVHEPRAGGDERLRRGHAERRLLAGRAALRAPDRHDAAGAAAAALGGAGRDGAADQGGGGAAAERPAEHIRPPAEGRGRPQGRAGPARRSSCAVSSTGS